MALDKKGVAFVLEEKELKTDFKPRFKKLVTDTEIQKSMEKALKALAKPEAAQLIVNEMIKLL